MSLCTILLVKMFETFTIYTSIVFIHNTVNMGVQRFHHKCFDGFYSNINRFTQQRRKTVLIFGTRFSRLTSWSSATSHYRGYSLDKIINHHNHKYKVKLWPVKDSDDITHGAAICGIALQTHSWTYYDTQTRSKLLIHLSFHFLPAGLGFLALTVEKEQVVLCVIQAGGGIQVSNADRLVRRRHAGQCRGSHQPHSRRYIHHQTCSHGSLLRRLRRVCKRTRGQICTSRLVLYIPL